MACLFRQMMWRLIVLPCSLWLAWSAPSSVKVAYDGETGQRAGLPGDNYCTRRIARDRAHDLLSGEDSQLVPLAEALISAAFPRSILNRLSRSGGQLLVSLAAGQAEVTHDLLDDLPQDHDTRAVRNLLSPHRSCPPK